MALVLGPLAMVASKGGDMHRRCGMLYLWSTVLLVVASFIIALDTLGVLETLVALFAFHLAATGYRSLHHKKLHEGQRPQRMDVTVQAISASLFGAAFLWGLAHVMLGHRDREAFVYLGFGAGGLLVIGNHMRRFYKRSHDKREWLYGHMSAMLASYGATLTACSVMYLDMLSPGWLRWAWPALLVFPLARLWMRHYRGVFANGGRVHRLFKVRIRAVR
jgi:positive regulator of sigma E activity